MMESTSSPAHDVLHAYLLGSVPFEDALALQRRLFFQISGDRKAGAIVLCEHPPIITVGRQGSRAHILCDPTELTARQWSVRWVNRGGGCVLHVPGQLAVYATVPLEPGARAVPSFLKKLHSAFSAMLGEFDIATVTHVDRPGVWARDRLIAAVGIGVRNWVTYYGAVININPDLELFRRVRVGDDSNPIMTSLERERRGRVKPSFVRERLLEHFSTQFGYGRTSLFHDYPQLRQKAKSDAFVTRS